MRNVTLVIGCGKLGGAIAAYASAQGESVVVVDRNKASFARLSDMYTGVTILTDISDIDAIEELEPEKVKEVVIATGDDNLNLFLSHLFAEIYSIPYIYVRFEDPDKGLLIQGMPIKALYPLQLSIDRFNTLKGGVK